MGAECPRLPICIDIQVLIYTTIRQRTHRPPNSLAGVKGLHSVICKFKRHPDTAKDEELFECLMSGCSVPLADTTPHLLRQWKAGSFVFSSPFFGSSPNKRVLSTIGTMACSTQVHLPMTCCPQVAMTTDWGKRSPRSYVCCYKKNKAKQSFLLGKSFNKKNFCQYPSQGQESSDGVDWG